MRRRRAGDANGLAARGAASGRTSDRPGLTWIPRIPFRAILKLAPCGHLIPGVAGAAVSPSLSGAAVPALNIGSADDMKGWAR